MMNRIHRRLAKQTSPCWPGDSFHSSHLDLSSVDGVLPGSHEGPARQDYSYSSLLFLWANRSTPVVVEPFSESDGLNQIPIDTSIYKHVGSSWLRDAHDKFPRSNRSPRFRRHVPIIIPDFAHPFAADHDNFNHDSRHTTPSTPSFAPESETPLHIDACVKRSRPTNTPVTAEHDLLPRINPTKMNSSQISLTGLDQGHDNANAPPPSAVSASGAHVGISPGVPQSASGPTNLSGLVCNVHRTSGEEPNALVGATTTVLGDKLYVFGGRIHSRTKPKLTADMYELDLIRRRWSKMETFGDIPPPRYFHSVCALGDTKLVCYGGMSPAIPSQGSAEPQPEVIVMSDVHLFDVPTRTWTLIGGGETPQGRYAHCASILPSSGVFTSPTAPLSAIHHNPSSSDPHSGTLGVQLDGTAGAEMVVVGGQDKANNYIEQISVFNLRSLKWTNTTAWDRKCGAYKSMVAPITSIPVDMIGKGVPSPEEQQAGRKPQDNAASILIYSNYNFLDVKLELQIRLPNGTVTDRPISGTVSPPGLRFPNGGIIDNHFVVSGTYLTSSKHEYALWALDLRTLTWGRIDTNGTVFNQGSWNRGVLWNRRNTFVILGHRKRSLVDDYNHRRINFAHVCLVELEAFGLYDNPRRSAPTSGYVSISSPPIPASLQASLPTQTAGGRALSKAAEQLGQAAMSITEMADMELVAIGGERIPCNSFMLSKRWGPYFNQLLLDSATSHESNSVSDSATLRPMHSQASRNSSITITPSLGTGTINPGVGAIAASSSDGGIDSLRSASRATTRTLEMPTTSSVPPSARPRSLFLPHMVQTIQLMLHYLYTSSLPPVGGPLCTPHILCSLLQMARPYQIDGLLEATVERLHEVLDGRNAAAVFNAAAMAAGGGRGFGNYSVGTLEMLERLELESQGVYGEPKSSGAHMAAKKAPLRINTSLDPSTAGGRESADSINSASTETSSSASTTFSLTDTESSNQDGSGDAGAKKDREEKEVWMGDVSSVIGLQKRGLRGLMEGRRLRERANTNPPPPAPPPSE